MGWSTQIVVVKSPSYELSWEDFVNSSIQIIEFNKSYLAQYMIEVINNFPEFGSELRYRTNDPRYDDGDGYHYCGWYYRELTKEVVEELLKSDSIERFADMYNEYAWSFKTKKERKEFIKNPFKRRWKGKICEKKLDFFSVLR